MHFKLWSVRKRDKERRGSFGAGADFKMRGCERLNFSGSQGHQALSDTFRGRQGLRSDEDGGPLLRA
jgi:hypothetical protein